MDARDSSTTVPLGDLTFRRRTPGPDGLAALHGDALDDAFEALWAPEVAYDNGVFYMYYGAG